MSAFLTPVQFCYDALCSRILVPWVTEFEELANKDQDVAILRTRSGEFKQGLYVRQQGFWVLALNYSDLCTSLNDNVSLKIVVVAASTQQFPNSKIYRNGYLVPGSTQITASNTIVWVVGTLTGNSGGGIVTLTDMFNVPIGNFLVE